MEAKELMNHSILDVIMKINGLSSRDLSEKSRISVSTISALCYGNRDIGKLEASKLLFLSHALNVKMEKLLPSIELKKSE